MLWLVLERCRIDRAHPQLLLEPITVGLLHVWPEHMDLVFAHVLQAPVVGAMAVTHPGHEHAVLGWIGLQTVLADSRRG